MELERGLLDAVAVPRRRRWREDLLPRAERGGAAGGGATGGSGGGGGGGGGGGRRGGGPVIGRDWGGRGRAKQGRGQLLPPVASREHHLFPLARLNQCIPELTFIDPRSIKKIFFCTVKICPGENSDLDNRATAGHPSMAIPPPPDQQRQCSALKAQLYRCLNKAFPYASICIDKSVSQ